MFSKRISILHKKIKYQNLEIELNIVKKTKLITRNLAEIMNHEKTINRIKNIIVKRSLRIYWGTAPTKAPHIAYFVPLSKLADFLAAGCTVIILIADLHAFLDSLKTPWFLLEFRVEYYRKVLTIMLRLLGISIKRLLFIRGSSFQMKINYTMDVYRLSAITHFNQAQRAGAEVVKQDENPMLAPILYPLLQALDEEYLNIDAQFGGIDQRKIFAYASDFLSKRKIGYNSHIHLMNPMVPNLIGSGKMSASEDFKIALTDSKALIRQKINSAESMLGETKNNGILTFFQIVVFPCFCKQKITFTINRRDEKSLIIVRYREIYKFYVKKIIHPADLKISLSNFINVMLNPIRVEFSLKVNQKLQRNAYPVKNVDGECGEKIQLNVHQKWILAQFKIKGCLPLVRVIRNHSKLSKREAKYNLDFVRKILKNKK